MVSEGFQGGTINRVMAERPWHNPSEDFKGGTCALKGGTCALELQASYRGHGLDSLDLS